GGWLKTDADGQYKLAALVKPMVLDHATTPGDVAVGVSQNSLVALVTNRDNIPYEMVFDNRGNMLSSATPVMPKALNRDVQVGQNIAMVLLVLMLTLSLWQWR